MGNFKNHIRDWTSRKWHSTHNWKTGTGKLIKRTLAKGYVFWLERSVKKLRNLN